MDDALRALLIRLAGELAVTLISLFRRLGQDDQAKALAAIVAETDAEWALVKANAQAALNEPL